MSDHNSTRIFDIMVSIDGCAQLRDWTSIDALLREVEWEVEPVDCIIAHLRVSYPMRSKLTVWEQSLMRAAKSITTRYGVEKAKRSLQGLPVCICMVLK